MTAIGLIYHRSIDLDVKYIGGFTGEIKAFGKLLNIRLEFADQINGAKKITRSW